MSYLLDTNILSETRKPHRNPGVTEWLTAVPSDRLHLSALTIGEIERGITQLRARGDKAQVTMLSTWLDDVVSAFDRRIVPVTAEIAREWGRQRRGRPVVPVDGLIAATAAVHGWTLVTRNTKDFEATGVDQINPFTD